MGLASACRSRQDSCTIDSASSDSLAGLKVDNESIASSSPCAPRVRVGFSLTAKCGVRQQPSIIRGVVFFTQQAPGAGAA